MEKATPLTSLIKSLTKSEKRYFKIYMARFYKKKQNPYVLLFDLIEKYGEENWPRIRENYPLKKISEGQLRLYKHQLYKELLDSLAAFQTGNSLESSIRQLLSHVKILLGKGLYDSAAAILQKADQLALKYEFSLIQLEISGLEKQVHEAKQFQDMNLSTIDNLFNEEEKILEQVHTKSYLWKKNAEMLFNFRTRGIARNTDDLRHYDSIKDSLKLPESDTPLLFASSLNLDAFYHNYYRGIQSFGKPKEELNSSRLFNENPHMIQIYPKAFINVFTSELSILTEQRKPEVFAEIKRLEEILVTYKKWLPDNIFFFARLNILIHSLKAYISTGDFTSAFTELKSLEGFFDQHQEKISPYFTISLYSLSAFLFLGLNQYAEALKQIQKVFQLKTHLQQDIYSICRILVLIIYYERKDTDLLAYELKSVYRYLNRINKLYLFEKLMMDFIRLKTRHIISRKDELEAFKELRAELLNISGLQLEKGFLNYFDIISWLESKIENQSFETILRKKANLLEEPGELN